MPASVMNDKIRVLVLAFCASYVMLVFDCYRSSAKVASFDVELYPGGFSQIEEFYKNSLQFLDNRFGRNSELVVCVSSAIDDFLAFESDSVNYETYCLLKCRGIEIRSASVSPSGY
jgi:hypothetical protein